MEIFDYDAPPFTLDRLCTDARVVDVYDGDTITCVIPVFKTYFRFQIRLFGINACEIRNKDNQLKQKAFEARKKIIDTICPQNEIPIDCDRNAIQGLLKCNTVIVRLQCYKFDKYGRVLAKVFAGESDISSILLKSKLAIEYTA